MRATETNRGAPGIKSELTYQRKLTAGKSSWTVHDTNGTPPCRCGTLEEPIGKRGSSLSVLRGKWTFDDVSEAIGNTGIVLGKKTAVDLC